MGYRAGSLSAMLDGVTQYLGRRERQRERHIVVARRGETVQIFKKATEVYRKYIHSMELIRLCF